MRFHKKPFEPNSYSIEHARTPFSFSRFFVLVGVDADEQGRRAVEGSTQERNVWVTMARTKGYVPIIQTTIVRLSLNDANKFDYFWFQILLLGKWHHRHCHRRPPPSPLPCHREHEKGGNTPEYHLPRFEPTAHPPGP